MGLLRECYRRYQLYRHAPRHWKLRPSTIDRRIFRHVVIDNEYRLPPRFSPDDAILDIGAHIGSFALACLRRGAGHVLCCEPDDDNFRLLQHNLAPFADRVTLIRAAAWHNNPPTTLTIHNPLDPRNTGAVRVGPVGTTVPAVAFDDLVARLGRVRLAKLDCEGAEWHILPTSTTLSRIEALCGEYHLDFADSPTPELLRETLSSQGFHVELTDAPGSRLPVGMFFAR